MPLPVSVMVPCMSVGGVVAKELSAGVVTVVEGGVVSRVIVWVRSVVVLSPVSLNRIWTVLGPSVVVRVWDWVSVQVVQLVGLEVLPKAILMGVQLSVGQVMFKVTEEVFVLVASLLMVKEPPVGAEVSIVVFPWDSEL